MEISECSVEKGFHVSEEGLILLGSDHLRDLEGAEVGDSHLGLISSSQLGGIPTPRSI